MTDPNTRLAATMGRDSDDVLATGTATINQLASLFRMKGETVSRQLADLAPSARRKGFPVYVIAEAASFLVKPGYEIEEKLRRMNQADLPALLGKEFWNGQRARQAFEEDQGDLWRTADVLAVFSEAAAALRMVLLLMLDSVERETSVTTRQREIIKRHTDGGITAMNETLFEKFANHPAPQDNVSADVEDVL